MDVTDVSGSSAGTSSGPSRTSPRALQNAPDARFPFQAKAEAFFAWGRGSRSAPDRGESSRSPPGSQGWVVFLLVLAWACWSWSGSSSSNCPSAGSGAVRQADGRPADVRRHHHLHPDQGQPGRGHPGHLRLLTAYLPALYAQFRLGQQDLVLDLGQLRQGRPPRLHGLDFFLSSCSPTSTWRSRSTRRRSPTT